MLLLPRFDRAAKWLLPSLLAAAGGFCGGTTAAGAATCSENQIVLTGVNVVSIAAALDTVGSNSHGSYDLKTGYLSSNVSFNEPGWASSSVATDDEYRVVGLPAGTPVDFTAEFPVSGSWNVYPGVPQGNFTCEGSIASGADSAGFALPEGGCCHGTLSQPLAISLQRLAQEPFHIRLRLAAQDYRGRVDASGQLTFTGLPPGAAVVSCQGFATDPAIVAVGPRSGPAIALRIAEIRPNPTPGALDLTLRLPDSAPARLEVFDLLGRAMVSRDLRPAGPGSYVVRFDEARTLPAGVYTIRLAQAGRRSTATFAVVR